MSHSGCSSAKRLQQVCSHSPLSLAWSRDGLQTMRRTFSPPPEPEHPLSAPPAAAAVAAAADRRMTSLLDRTRGADSFLRMWQFLLLLILAGFLLCESFVMFRFVLTIIQCSQKIKTFLRTKKIFVKDAQQIGMTLFRFDGAFRFLRAIRNFSYSFAVCVLPPGRL